jgi:hypothetical protein
LKSQEASWIKIDGESYTDKKEDNDMPFTKRGLKYYHKGRAYTKKQVKKYYASKGTFSKAKKKAKRKKKK